MEKSLTQLFQINSNRFSELTLENEFLLADFSKNHLESLDFLTEPQKNNLISARNNLFSGSNINHTENRSAMHFRLRRSRGEDDLDIEVQKVRSQFIEFGERVFQSQLVGYTGKTINTVVNIGIGGSDLGPKFLVDALKDYQKDVNVLFVSNVDGLAIRDTLEAIHPETTLFIVCSKTFSTQETIQNALTAKEWLISNLGEKSVSQHFVAVSTNQSLAMEFGISPSHIFGFWDWVGGRYSLWSAVGLSLVCSIGAENFRSLLEGAESADLDFQNLPLEQNLSVLLAAIDYYYFHQNGFTSKVIAAYSHRLSLFVPFVQQLVMESNGKGTDNQGQPISKSGVVWWGAPGTDAQHSFFQLIHQGKEKIHVEFIGVALQKKSPKEHQSKLLSNLLAQSRALMIGQESNSPEKYFSGNRPSTTLLLREITPRSMGYLIATFENRVFCEAVLLNINPFDQFGVELGKKLCNELLPFMLLPNSDYKLDASTHGLIQFLHKNG